MKIMRMMVVTVLAATLGAAAQNGVQKNDKTMDDCPLHAQHMAQKAIDQKSEDQKFEQMTARGNVSMGFDQQKTTHHFRSLADGGAIEVTVKDADDAANLAAIRQHLRQIADDFSRGDFSSPLATHGELPTGAAEMLRMRAKIAYRYEEIENGGQVRISTQDPTALKAIQQFLGYQVTEHRTGDASGHKH